MKLYLIVIRIIWLALVGLGLFSCESKYCKEQMGKKFSLPIEYSTQDEVLKIGDTIYIESEWNNSIIDENTGDVWVIKDAEIASFFNIFTIDSFATEIQSGFENFEVIVPPYLKHQFMAGALSNMPWLALHPDYVGENYTFKFAIIPLEEGCYRLDFASEYFGNATEEDLNIEGYECKEFGGGFVYKRVNAGDGNSYLLEGNEYLSEFPNEVYILLKENQRFFDEDAGYCFCVEE
jgi:hypothetical protein